LLRQADDALIQASTFVEHIVEQVSPINRSLVNIHSDVHHWKKQGEDIRWYAVLAPMAATLVYVMLEMIATCNPLPCCDVLCRVSR
jgi:hypothetical protein